MKKSQTSIFNKISGEYSLEKEQLIKDEAIKLHSNPTRSSSGNTKGTQNTRISPQTAYSISPDGRDAYFQKNIVGLTDYPHDKISYQSMIMLDGKASLKIVGNHDHHHHAREKSSPLFSLCDMFPERGIISEAERSHYGQALPILRYS
jgi:hypothetical protein